MSRRRQSPGAERQEWYRATHPQINITFRDRAEHDRVQGALLRQHQTARAVLLAWVAGGEAAAPPQPVPGSSVTSDSAPGTPVTSDSPPAAAAPVPPGAGPRPRAVGPA